MYEKILTLPNSQSQFLSETSSSRVSYGDLIVYEDNLSRIIRAPSIRAPVQNAVRIHTIPLVQSRISN